MRPHSDGALCRTLALLDTMKVSIVSSGSGANRAGSRARASLFVAGNFRFYISIYFLSVPS